MLVNCCMCSSTCGDGCDTGSRRWRAADTRVGSLSTSLAMGWRPHGWGRYRGPHTCRQLATLCCLYPVLAAAPQSWGCDVVGRPLQHSASPANAWQCWASTWLGAGEGQLPPAFARSCTWPSLTSSRHSCFSVCVPKSTLTSTCAFSDMLGGHLQLPVHAGCLRLPCPGGHRGNHSGNSMTSRLPISPNLSRLAAAAAAAAAGTTSHYQAIHHHPLSRTSPPP
jgi:hypothetical protein